MAGHRDLMAVLPDGGVDLCVSSPPYCMGKAYEKSYSVYDFERDHKEIAPALISKIKPEGSLCWQVGSHVRRGTLVPLDFIAHGVFGGLGGLVLRNRIVWQFGHGMHEQRRFSGRHETVLWYTKGDGYTFNLDAVRVPQKYPGKRSYRGPRKGEYSGNPRGKNPADVWDIPNVKANHVEKTGHPCQFPVALAQRLIRALTNPRALVFDPFAGVASTGIAALADNRRFIGAETSAKYVKLAEERYRRFLCGDHVFRSIELAVHIPKGTESVSRKPDHFLWRIES